QGLHVDGGVGEQQHPDHSNEAERHREHDDEGVQVRAEQSHHHQVDEDHCQRQHAAKSLECSTHGVHFSFEDQCNVLRKLKCGQRLLYAVGDLATAIAR